MSLVSQEKALEHSCPCSQIDATKRREIIFKHYGNPMLISEAFREKTEAWRPIHEGDREGLRSFPDFLEQVSVSIDS